MTRKLAVVIGIILATIGTSRAQTFQSQCVAQHSRSGGLADRQLDIEQLCRCQEAEIRKAGQSPSGIWDRMAGANEQLSEDRLTNPAVRSPAVKQVEQALSAQQKALFDAARSCARQQAAGDPQRRVYDILKSRSRGS